MTDKKSQNEYILSCLQKLSALNKKRLAIDELADDIVFINQTYELFSGIVNNYDKYGEDKLCEISTYISKVFGDIVDKKYTLSSQILELLSLSINNSVKLLKTLKTGKKLGKKLTVDLSDLMSELELFIKSIDEKPESATDVILVDRRGDTKERREKDNRRVEKEIGRRKNDKSKNSSLIRVNTNKIDELINMVGELVITQSMLGVLGDNFDISKIDRLQDGLAELERHTRQLQESIMCIRMIPIGSVFNKFPRLVHDLSISQGKQIDLKISGETTELDKTVVEQIDELIHQLVINSVLNGIEHPENRINAEKPSIGEIQLNAYHKGGNIIIEISDDGQGLNTEQIRQYAEDKKVINDNDDISDERIHELIFHPLISPLFNTQSTEGNIALNIIRERITQLSGNIEISSKLAHGTMFRISLPLTLAILDGQIISVGNEMYVVPIASIIESIQVKPEMINKVSGKGEVFELRGEYLPIVRMHEYFSVMDGYITELDKGILVVVEGDGKKCGLFIDELLEQQQIVIKSLETNLVRINGLSGATIFGDGSVALILDIPRIVRQIVDAEISSVSA